MGGTERGVDQRSALSSMSIWPALNRDVARVLQ